MQDDDQKIESPHDWHRMSVPHQVNHHHLICYCSRHIINYYGTPSSTTVIRHVLLNCPPTNFDRSIDSILQYHHVHVIN